MNNISIKIDKPSNTNLLIPKEYLQRDFWDEKVLFPEISDALMKIAKSVLESMEIDAEIKDIVITGSLASYNWHDLSDIDLHIIFDFEEIDENYELVKRMLDQSRINWNKAHNIMIKGHEVELYFQDDNEPHKANGVWSLKDNNWVVEPKIEDVDIDLPSTEKKAEAIAKSIDHAEGLLKDGKAEEAYEYASKIKNKVSNMRSAGLSNEGIYSAENLAFKMLRNSKYLEKLSNIKINAYDKMYSLTETYVKDYFNELTDPDRYEFGDGGGVERLLDDSVPAPWDKEEEDEL
jgi:predicted nucleotidyltransferase